MAFGDLFLEDIRAYRETQMAKVNMTPLFPVWGINTTELAHEMIAVGLKARLTCVDPRKLDASFAGREFDEQLLRDLPPGTDPCGENGEFHSFVYAGPMFRHAIPIETGEVVERDGFVFADLLPAREAEAALILLAAQGGDNFCDVVILKQSDARDSRGARRNAIARVRERDSAEGQDRHAGSESGLDFLVVSGDTSACQT